MTTNRPSLSPLTSQVSDEVANSSHHSASTSFKLDFPWTIANFSQIKDETQSEFPFVTSAKFSAPEHPSVQFELVLFPNGVSKDNQGNVSIYLFINFDGTKNGLVVDYKMSIIDGAGKRCHEQSKLDISNN